MLTERPNVTTERFIHSWTSSEVDRNRLIAELLSVSNETNRRPDASYYEFKDGKLTDPETGRPILDFIAPGMEYQVALELQKKAAMADEGVFIWNSPKLEGVYPCNKTIFYQIAYTGDFEKVLLYSAILYDGNIENPEEHRKTLISAPDEDNTYFGVLSWIEEVSNQKQNFESGKNYQHQATYYADQIKNGVDPGIIVEEMRRSGFLGNNPVSCTGLQSFSDYTSSKANILIYANAKDEYGSLAFTCSLGHENVRKPGKFRKTCSTCGEDVSCGNPNATDD